MRERESALKNNRGMTLIEVLVALAIVFIIFLGLSDAGIIVLNENIRNSMRDEAVSVADREIQRVRGLAFDNVVAVPSDNVTRQVRGMTVTYNVSRNVNILDTNNKQVAVTVGWTRQNRTYSHGITTIVRQR